MRYVRAAMSGLLKLELRQAAPENPYCVDAGASAFEGFFPVRDFEVWFVDQELRLIPRAVAEFFVRPVIHDYAMSFGIANKFKSSVACFSAGQYVDGFNRVSIAIWIDPDYS